MEEFSEMLEERMAAATAQERAAVDTRIRQRYERRRAVLISDMEGFSRITQEQGILHFLALIQRMQTICLPRIAGNGGHLVKAEADNLYAMFHDPQTAVNAAVAMMDACDEAFEGKGPNDRVRLGIGIAFGPVLDIDGMDFWGDPVNVASKLGEDLADGGDLFMAAQAAEMVTPPPGWRTETKHERISNIEIDYAALVRV